MSDEQEVVENHDDSAEPSPAPEAVDNEVVEDSSAAETPEQVKKPSKVQERINQLTREKHAERTKNAELEERLKALESKPAAEEKEVKATPKEDDFDNFSDFEQAKETHIADRAAQVAYDRLKAEQSTTDANSQAKARQVELETKKATFDENVDSKRGNFEDFDEVALGHEFMDVDLAEQIFEMDKGPEVAYHLGSNLDVAEKLIRMTPVQRARELTKMEFSLEALKPKTVSDAPDPITPIGGTDKSGNKSPEEMTDKEWRDWRNNQINARNNHG
ncbi:MAG: hypothetical protein V3U84_11005 [Thiotrichaceae bacterium]